MHSFLQTEEWLKFQEYIGHKTWRFDDGKIRANIIQHKISLRKNYLYIPHGPEIFFDNISDGLKNEIANFLKYLKNLAKENKSIFIKMEPLSDVVVEMLFRKDLKRSPKQLQPYRTVIVNLDLSEEELLSRMHHKTRYNIKVAERNHIRVEDSNDFDAFWALLKKTSKRDRFHSHEKEYYKKLLNLNSGELKTDLILAYYNDHPSPEDFGKAGKPVAGAIVLCYGDTCYYLHGASDYELRSLMAPYALHWEIIKALKNQNSKIQIPNSKFYDLWGIDQQKWPGVTRFKLGWGGDMKEYPGSFNLVVSKFWYFMYNLARKIF